MHTKINSNCHARLLSENIWKKYMSESKLICIWILLSNFFVCILPGVLFFATNVRISQESNEYLSATLPILPTLRNIVSWFGVIFVLAPIVISIIDIIFFHRFIILRMSRTCFIGQIISVILLIIL